MSSERAILEVHVCELVQPGWLSDDVYKVYAVRSQVFFISETPANKKWDRSREFYNLRKNLVLKSRDRGEGGLGPGGAVWLF